MPLSTGSTAPDFLLPATDGKTYSLATFADRLAVAVVFSCNHCPYVQAYEDRMIALQAEYGEQGFVLIAINANETQNHPEDSFEHMVARAQQRSFNFPYLRDDDQVVAESYGAEKTPHIFLFDQERKLAYTGAIDDNWKEPERVTQTWLADAIEAVLAGKPVAAPETHAIGCSIKWNS